MEYRRRRDESEREYTGTVERRQGMEVKEAKQIREKEKKVVYKRKSKRRKKKVKENKERE